MKRGFQKVKLAMKIGGKYRVHEIGVHQWGKLADEIHLDRDALFARLRLMCKSLPDHAADVLRSAKKSSLEHPVLDHIVAKIQARARAAAKEFQ